jgi:hypothetical protein
MGEFTCLEATRPRDTEFSITIHRYRLNLKRGAWMIWELGKLGEWVEEREEEGEGEGEGNETER